MVAKANDSVGKGRKSTDVLLADIVHIDTVGEKASDKTKVKTRMWCNITTICLKTTCN